MKYLANENIPPGTINDLRGEGTDIQSVKEVLPGAKDKDVLLFSIRESRILVTFDKDFGELVFKDRSFTPQGIILLRFPPKSEAYIAEELRALFRREINFERHFTIVSEDKIRVVPL